MEAVAAEPPKQQNSAVAMSSLSQTSAEMEAEANQKGYGRAYAAFGGGREGLEACAASECFLLQCGIISFIVLHDQDLCT